MVDWDGRAESLEGIERTIYAAAYEASSVASPRVLVVGVGGGFDILTALRYDAREVTGVEINGATLDIVTRVYRDYCGAWSKHPRVRLIEDEGRHHLAVHPDRYDILQLSGVDSYSGTPGAAHVFSESYLYTAEAFDLYFSRLTENGILNVMRLEQTPEREMLKALVTAVGNAPAGRHRDAGRAHPARDVARLELHGPAREEGPLHGRREAPPGRLGRRQPVVPLLERRSPRGTGRPGSTSSSSASAARRWSGPSWPPTRTTSRRRPTTAPSSSSTPPGGTCSPSTGPSPWAFRSWR